MQLQHFLVVCDPSRQSSYGLLNKQADPSLICLSYPRVHYLIFRQFSLIRDLYDNKCWTQHVRLIGKAKYRCSTSRFIYSGILTLLAWGHLTNLHTLCIIQESMMVLAPSNNVSICNPEVTSRITSKTSSVVKNQSPKTGGFSEKLHHLHKTLFLSFCS